MWMQMFAVMWYRHNIQVRHKQILKWTTIEQYYFIFLSTSHQVQYCSETALTGNPSSKVWVTPTGRELLPPVAGSKRLVHWTSETWWKCEKCRSSTGLPLPLSKGYGPYRILAVCPHNLWPAVRTKLGQGEWLRSRQKQQAKKTYCSWWSGIMSGSPLWTSSKRDSS